MDLISFFFFEQIAGWNSTSTVPARKMVVITSRLLSDAHRYILRCLGTHQTIVDCRIFTSISEVSHSAHSESPLGPDAFREYASLLRLDYEELIKKDKKNKMGCDNANKCAPSTALQGQTLSGDADCWSQVDPNGDFSPKSEASSSVPVEPEQSDRLVISVQHFPMIYCALSPRVFILPSEGAIAEARLSDDHEMSLSAGLPTISTGHPSDGDEIPPGAMLTAHFLYHLAAKMDLKMDIFSLGDLSKHIGKILTDMSSLYDVGRRSKRSAGLLIIDRSLDLLTPCCHGDAVIDWMISSLPRRERTTSFSHAKNAEVPNKANSTSVQHPPLDVKIPVGEALGRGWSPTGNDQFSDSIAAFMSGWNSSEVGNDSVDLNVYKDKVHPGNFMLNEFDLLSGSLVSSGSYKGVNYLEALLDRGIKDGVMLIKKWLLGTLHQDRVSTNLKNRGSSSSELLSMVKLLASNQKSFIRNKGIIQLAAACIFSLREPHNSHWNALLSAETILKMSNGDSSQSLSSQLRDLINTSVLLGSKQDATNESSKGLISFQDALLLAVIGYILAGENFPTSVSSSPFSWEEEHSLKEAVVDAILDMPSTNLRFLHGLEGELEARYGKNKIEKQETTMESSNIEDLDDNWDSWGDDPDQNNEPAYGEMQLKLEVRDRVDQLFKFLHKISSLKWKNPAFRDRESRFGSDSFSDKGLLFKLLLMVLAKYDVPELEYHSSAVGRFFKSGFGRFGLGQAKPSLGDQSILLVFVVGGINCLEVREAQEAILKSGRQDVELLIGGTTLLSPENMFELLLGASSYI
ncbi:hypothetical protein Taro_003833 [Colocasia esculenta]|uniref:Sec1 family domain-containing protein MIP3 n=1 Tax=Colocasia esculenta TaxID=4460 RepID=A0A843TT05_COLES|nr:hypothetical protein [Colocasia esculenta]